MTGNWPENGQDQPFWSDLATNIETNHSAHPK